MASSEGKKCQPFTFTDCKAGKKKKRTQEQGRGSTTPGSKNRYSNKDEKKGGVVVGWGLGLEYFLEVLGRVLQGEAVPKSVE